MSDLAELKQQATTFWRSQNFAGAIQCLRKVVELEPQNGHVWNSLAICLTAVRRHAEAVGCFKEATRLEPSVVAFQCNLGRACAADEKLFDAMHAFRRALALNPASEDGLKGLIDTAGRLGRLEEQVDALYALGELRPLLIDERLMRAEVQFRLSRQDAALADVETVLELEPDHAGAHLLRAVILQQQGKHAVAVGDLYQAIQINPNFAPAYWYLTQSMRFSENERPLVTKMEAAAAVSSLQVADQGILQFALGSAYNDLGEYERAMAAFNRANAISRSLGTVHFNADNFERSIDDIIAIFCPEMFDRHSELAVNTELPLFVVGMPRSGTTLVESILSSHPLVAAGGELPFWTNVVPMILGSSPRAIDVKKAQESRDRYLALLRTISPQSQRVTDKQPYNFLHVGLLHLLYPYARFVHCRRHPVDTCLSLFSTSFNTPPVFSYSKKNLVFAYRQYLRLMAHWRSVITREALLEVEYEELVLNQEPTTHRLIESCGLDWNVACLKPEKNERVITTMSHWQARQTVYSSSIERWRHYEPWLEEFQELFSQ